MDTEKTPKPKMNTLIPMKSERRSLGTIAAMMRSVCAWWPAVRNPNELTVTENASYVDMKPNAMIDIPKTKPEKAQGGKLMIIHRVNVK